MDGQAVELIAGHLPLAPPPGMPVWDVDPYDPAILADPHDYYAKLRARGQGARQDHSADLDVGTFRRFGH